MTSTSDTRTQGDDFIGGTDPAPSNQNKPRNKGRSGCFGGLRRAWTWIRKKWVPLVCCAAGVAGVVADVALPILDAKNGKLDSERAMAYGASLGPAVLLTVESSFHLVGKSTKVMNKVYNKVIRILFPVQFMTSNVLSNGGSPIDNHSLWDPNTPKALDSSGITYAFISGIALTLALRSAFLAKREIQPHAELGNVIVGNDSKPDEPLLPSSNSRQINHLCETSNSYSPSNLIKFIGEQAIQTAPAIAALFMKSRYLKSLGIFYLGKVGGTSLIKAYYYAKKSVSGGKNTKLKSLEYLERFLYPVHLLALGVLIGPIKHWSAPLLSGIIYGANNMRVINKFQKLEVNPFKDGVKIKKSEIASLIIEEGIYLAWFTAVMSNGSLDAIDRGAIISLLATIPIGYFGTRAVATKFKPNNGKNYGTKLLNQAFLFVKGNPEALAVPFMVDRSTQNMSGTALRHASPLGKGFLIAGYASFGLSIGNYIALHQMNDQLSEDEPLPVPVIQQILSGVTLANVFNQDYNYSLANLKPTKS